MLSGIFLGLSLSIGIAWYVTNRQLLDPWSIYVPMDYNKIVVTPKEWHLEHCESPNTCQPQLPRATTTTLPHPLLPPHLLAGAKDLAMASTHNQVGWVISEGYAWDLSCCAAKHEFDWGWVVAECPDAVMLVEPCEDDRLRLSVVTKTHCITPSLYPIKGVIQMNPRENATWANHWHYWIAHFETRRHVIVPAGQIPFWPKHVRSYRVSTPSATIGPERYVSGLIVYRNAPRVLTIEPADCEETQSIKESIDPDLRKETIAEIIRQQIAHVSRCIVGPKGEQGDNGPPPDDKLIAEIIESKVYDHFKAFDTSAQALELLDRLTRVISDNEKDELEINETTRKRVYQKVWGTLLRSIVITLVNSREYVDKISNKVAEILGETTSGESEPES